MGIVRSKRAPTKMHPYGYMKDKFVWSLVSAVGIFCLGAGVTCAHGFSNLFAPPAHLEHLGYGLAGDDSDRHMLHPPTTCVLNNKNFAISCTVHHAWVLSALHICAFQSTCAHCVSLLHFVREVISPLA